jgi:hypothetical protein
MSQSNTPDIRAQVATASAEISALRQATTLTSEALGKKNELLENTIKRTQALLQLIAAAQAGLAIVQAMEAAAGDPLAILALIGRGAGLGMSVFATTETMMNVS